MLRHSALEGSEEHILWQNTDQNRDQQINQRDAEKLNSKSEMLYKFVKQFIFLQF